MIHRAFNTIADNHVKASGGNIGGIACTTGNLVTLDSDFVKRAPPVDGLTVYPVPALAI